MRRLAPLALVTALAGFFRIYQLDVIPPGLFIDEALNGLVADEIREGDALPVFAGVVEEVKGRGREPMYHYLMAAVFAAFGPTVESLRLTSALIGIATVVAGFWLADRLFGPRIACIAAVLLACSRWHVIFSRIGFRAVLVPLWIILTLLAFEAAARKRTAAAAALGGAVLGLGFYAYPSYWIVPAPLMIIGWLAVRRASLRTLWAHWHLAMMAALGLLVALAPLIAYLTTHHETYFARAIEISTPVHEAEGRVARLSDHIGKVLLMLHVRGDPEARHNIPGKSQLDPITGTAFLLGLAALIRATHVTRAVKTGLILFWLLPLLPSVVTEAAPHAMRTLGALPAVCLIAALGIDGAARAAERPAALRRLRAGLIVIVAVLGSAAALSYHEYFHVWATDPRVARGFSTDMPRFHAYLVAAAGGDQMYASPYLHHSPNLRFLNLEKRIAMRLIADESAFVADADQQGDRVFVSESPAINFLVQQHYPGAEVLGRFGVAGASTGRIFRVKRDQLKPALTAGQVSQVRQLVGRAVAEWRAQARRM